jgi:hypothetical protein
VRRRRPRGRRGKLHAGSLARPRLPVKSALSPCKYRKRAQGPGGRGGVVRPGRGRGGAPPPKTRALASLPRRRIGGTRAPWSRIIPFLGPAVTGRARAWQAHMPLDRGARRRRRTPPAGRATDSLAGRARDRSQFNSHPSQASGISSRSAGGRAPRRAGRPGHPAGGSSLVTSLSPLPRRLPPLPAGPERARPGSIDRPRDARSLHSAGS